MPTKRCCCVQGCAVAADDFNRADSTSIGSQWTEHAGDWEILSNKLTVGEVGLVRHHSLSPYGTGNQNVYAKIYGMSAGTKHRLLLQVDATGTDYYYAEWHYVNVTTMIFTLGSSSAGVLKTITDTPVLDGTILRASMTDGGILCMSDMSSRISFCTDKKSGKYTGLGAGSSDGATFDDFVFDAHYADNPVCQSCDCGCDGECIKDSLVATFEDHNECPNLDGFSVALTNAGPTKFGPNWLQGIAVPCPGGIGGSENIQLKLACTGTNSGLEDLILSFDAGSAITTASGASLAAPDPSVSTCKPLSLRYGPFSYGNVSGCFNTTCCNGTPCDPAKSTFYIWVTE